MFKFIKMIGQVKVYYCEKCKHETRIKKDGLKVCVYCGNK